MDSQEDTNNDAALVSSANSNWEKLLCPTPLGIAVLGDLVAVASSTADFPLKVSDKPYEYLKYPNSFRASLVQISNAGYRAFSTAHANMDKIRLYSMKLPNHTKDVTEILRSNDPQAVSRCLKIPLKRIDEASKECLRLSQDVVGAFDGVINVTTELLVACDYTRGINEKERKLIRAQLQVKEKAKEEDKKRLEQLKSEKKKLEDEIDDALGDIKTTLDSVPSGRGPVDANPLEGLSNVFSLVILSSVKYMGKMFSSSFPVDTFNQAIDRIGESGNAIQAMQENAKLKVSAAQDRLKLSREHTAKIREEINKLSSEYQKSLEEMKAVKASELCFGKIVESLTKGLETLGKLKEHWSKLDQLFRPVSHIVEIVMCTELKSFTEYADEASRDRTLNPRILGMISGSASKVKQASFEIHNMANVYVQVSGRYVMGNLAKLDQLIAFDPATGGSIDVERCNLLESCERDSKAITEFVMSERRKIEEKIDTRMQQLEDSCPQNN